MFPLSCSLCLKRCSLLHRKPGQRRLLPRPCCRGWGRHGPQAQKLMTNRCAFSQVFRLAVLAPCSQCLYRLALLPTFASEPAPLACLLSWLYTQHMEISGLGTGPVPPRSKLVHEPTAPQRKHLLLLLRGRIKIFFIPGPECSFI